MLEHMGYGGANMSGTVRNSGKGQEQLLAAINQAIMDIQDK